MSKTTELFEIDRYEELPARRGSRGSKYPYATLQPQQRFFVPERTAKGMAGNVQSYFKAHPELGYKAALRTGEKDGVPGVYVYRIELDEALDNTAATASPRRKRSRKL